MESALKSVDENVRKPLTRSEAVAVAREIERVEAEKAPKGGRGFYSA